MTLTNASSWWFPLIQGTPGFMATFPTYRTMQLILGSHNESHKRDMPLTWRHFSGRQHETQTNQGLCLKISAGIYQNLFPMCQTLAPRLKGKLTLSYSTTLWPLFQAYLYKQRHGSLSEKHTPSLTRGKRFGAMTKCGQHGKPQTLNFSYGLFRANAHKHFFGS